MRPRRRIVLIFVLVVSVTLSFLYYLSLQDDRSLGKPPGRKKSRDFINHPVFDDVEESNLKLVTDIPRLHIFKYPNHLTGNESQCVTLKTFRGPTPICIFDPNVDRMISSYIRDYETWEEDLLNETGLVLEGRPSLTFVDIGCNIGTFTLFNAKLGRRVVCIDILNAALELVQKSLVLGGLEQNVTLLLNAVSDKRESVKVNIVKDNPGGSYIEHNKTGKSYVNAILLDDVLSVIGSGSIFLKLDIEGNEHKALKGGSKYFQVLDVQYILMEWMLHRYNPNGKEIIQFLLRNGMLPYEKLSRNKPLDLAIPYQWPDNIFWRKR